MLGMLTKDPNHPIQANPSIKNRSNYSQKRYEFLLYAPFNVSNKCCYAMKKAPAHKFARETGRKPMTAQMATESRLRTQKWLQNGCNGFDMKSPISNPMAFWTEQDILLYIKLNNISIAPVYGDIVIENGEAIVRGSENLELFEKEIPLLKTTGCSRTGCMFCGYGCHLEKSGEGRFVRLKKTHPKQYEYIMKGGHIRYEIYDKNGNQILLKHCSQDQINNWVKENQTNQNFRIKEVFDKGNGLGYKYIIDWINEHGGFHIEY